MYKAVRRLNQTVSAFLYHQTDFEGVPRPDAGKTEDGRSDYVHLSKYCYRFKLSFVIIDFALDSSSQSIS